MNRLLSLRTLVPVLVVANLAFVAALLTSGCEKNDTAGDEAAKPAAAVKVAPDQAAKTAQEPTRTATAEESDEGYSCAGDKNKEESCGDMEASEEGKGCNQWDEAAAEVIERDVPQNATWATLKVSGMTCGGCERRVIAKLGALDGVYSVEADAELGQVRVAMDKTKPDLAKVAAEKINSLGYRVQ